MDHIGASHIFLTIAAILVAAPVAFLGAMFLVATVRGFARGVFSQLRYRARAAGGVRALLREMRNK